MENKIKHLLTIDLEDWFHLLDNDETRTPEQWQAFPSRVKQNTHKLLDLFDAHGIKATFFVLGWIAEKYPDLIRNIQLRGHEIGCHSYAHQLIYDLTQKEFEQDLQLSLSILRDITGKNITLYRAPGFSITKDCQWAFDILAKNGISHDSSVFPAKRAHGGIINFPSNQFIIETPFGSIYEYPISTCSILGKKIVFSGGGYFRLLPYWFIKKQFTNYTKNDLPVVTYFHPRDIDPDQPLLKLSFTRRFKSYVGLSKTMGKLDRLLSDFKFINISQE